jgi:hypothetical protein
MSMVMVMVMVVMAAVRMVMKAFVLLSLEDDP